MSLKKLLAFCFLLVFILGGTYFFHSKSQPHENFAAGIPISQFSSKGVVDRIIDLKLSFDEVAKNTDKSSIHVKINMPFDFNEKLHYHWKLGQGVALHSGEIDGELDHLFKNETKEISIDVTGFSKEINHHVGFEIYGLKNGHKIYGEGLVASDLENTFESIVQNVEKIKASQ
jgi:hypothetical protein